MSRSPRQMQDAVIAMAIIVVLLALWRLHSHPRQLGWIGPWATTNISARPPWVCFPVRGLRGMGRAGPRDCGRFRRGFQHAVLGPIQRGFQRAVRQ